MCYLPKATFYVYFGFFFVGYIWIFGLLFFRTMQDNRTTKINEAVAAAANKNGAELLPHLAKNTNPNPVDGGLASNVGGLASNSEDTLTNSTDANAESSVFKKLKLFFLSAEYT